MARFGGAKLHEREALFALFHRMRIDRRGRLPKSAFRSTGDLLQQQCLLGAGAGADGARSIAMGRHEAEQ